MLEDRAGRRRQPRIDASLIGREPFPFAASTEWLALGGMDPEVNRIDGIVRHAAMGRRGHRQLGRLKLLFQGVGIGVKPQLLVHDPVHKGLDRSPLEKRIERVGDGLLGGQGQDRLTVFVFPVLVGKNKETDLAVRKVLADQQVDDVEVSGFHVGFFPRVRPTACRSHGAPDAARMVVNAARGLGRRPRLGQASDQFGVFGRGAPQVEYGPQPSRVVR